MNDKLILERVIAYGIDWYLTSMLCNIVLTVCYGLTGNSLEIITDITLLPLSYQILAAALEILLFGIYFYFLSWLDPKRKGQSIGKIVTHIKVVNTDGNDLSLKNSLIRSVLGFLIVEGVLYTPSYSLRAVLSGMLGSTAAVVLLYIAMAVSILSGLRLLIKKDGLMFHDLLSKTKVVHR